METENLQKIEWLQKAIRELSQIDRRYQLAIKTKVEKLVNFPQVPENLDIKHLEGSKYRLRHGDYRIFFEVIDDVPKIIQIQKVKRRKTTTYKN